VKVYDTHSGATFSEVLCLLPQSREIESIRINSPGNSKTERWLDRSVQDCKGFCKYWQKDFFQEALNNCRGHSEKLQKSMRLDVHKFSFSQRVVNHWNALKQHAIDCNTVNSFKRCVDRYITGRGFFISSGFYSLFGHVYHLGYALRGLLSWVKVGTVAIWWIKILFRSKYNKTHWSK